MTLRAAAEQALKPCPFCGSEPYSCRHLSYSNWGVTCLCGATGPTKNAGYRPLREAEIRAHNDAVAAWNERAALAAEQPQPEAVATLHDDGYWTWKRDEFRRQYGAQHAGWRMDVYAAPPPATPVQVAPAPDAKGDALDAPAEPYPNAGRHPCGRTYCMRDDCHDLGCQNPNGEKR